MGEEEKNAAFGVEEKADKYYAMVKKKRRHPAKSYGVKSVIASDGRTIMTAFDTGNKSIVEAEFQVKEENPGWEELKNEKTKFDAKKGNKPNISVKPINADGKSNGKPIDVEDPNFSSREIGLDQLKLKGKLEKYYFGQEFSNDNLHIQIIYNILDVKKIFCLYAQEMVVVLNNIIKRVNGGTLSNYKGQDYIGMFNIKEPHIAINGEDKDATLERKGKKKDKYYAVFQDFLKILKPYNIFFDEIFKYKPKKKEDNPNFSQVEADNYNWNVIRACGFIRNYFCHFEYDGGNAGTSDIVQALNKNKDVKRVVDEYAQHRLAQVEATFKKNAQRNMEILLLTLDKKDFEYGSRSNDSIIKERLKSFFRFSAEKRGKNLGIRIPSIKEALYDEIGIKDEDFVKHPERKGKLDGLLEYIVYELIKDNNELQAKTLSRLRARTCEEDKRVIYIELAKELYLGNKDVFDTLVIEFNNNIARADGDWYYNPENYKNPFLLDDDSELIGSSTNPKNSLRNILIFLSAFLEQKECNDLVTSLINKFENLLSLYDIATNGGIKIVMTERAGSMFEKKCLRKTLDGLYAIQGSFKLKKQIEGETKVNLFADAFNMFKTDDFFAWHINEDGEIENNSNFDAFIKPLLSSNRDWHTKLRNFASKNLVESRRFWYLVRYVDPKKVRSIMNIDKLVEYTLKSIPETQIDRYCSSCGIKEDGDAKNAKVEKLVKALKELTFDNLIYRKLNPTFEDEDLEARGPIRALLGLYFTVAYLIVKNMVQTNARYMLAYSCFARDYFFYSEEFDGGEACTEPKRGDYDKLINHFLAEHRFDKNKHVKQMIEKNYEEYKELVREYDGTPSDHRNKIEHFNYLKYLDKASDIRSVRSYYDVYQYIIQKCWYGWYEKGPRSKDQDLPIFSRMRENLEKYHLPQEDFVKIINFPLAYCVPRYKNMTISFLFNARNEEPKD